VVADIPFKDADYGLHRTPHICVELAAPIKRERRVDYDDGAIAWLAVRICRQQPGTGA
jgi:hypothetical protein